MNEYRYNYSGNILYNKAKDDDKLMDEWELKFFGNLLPGAKEDPDYDGLSNQDDCNIYQTDPTSEDTDDDGMTDGWEASYDLDPLFNDSTKDPDKDNAPNLIEFLNGPNARISEHLYQDLGTWSLVRLNDNTRGDGFEFNWHTSAFPEEKKFVINLDSGIADGEEHPDYSPSNCNYGLCWTIRAFFLLPATTYKKITVVRL